MILQTVCNKSRLVTCPKCELDYTTDEMNPKCPIHKENMITVVYSSLTGERITGGQKNADHLLISR